MQSKTQIKTFWLVFTTFLMLFLSIPITLHSQEETSNSHAKEGISDIFLKNLARMHLNSTLKIFDQTTRTYIPTNAAPAWLDDDSATGWTPPAGKQYYLLKLESPSLINHFAIDASETTGTVSLYIGDEQATPGASTWHPLATDLSIRDINGKVNPDEYSRYGQFLLIETYIEHPGKLWSLFVYGKEKSMDYHLTTRINPVDTETVLGQEVNESALFDLTGLYSGARVIAVKNNHSDKTAWQSAIDENPESFLELSGEKDIPPELIIDMGSEKTLRRLSAVIKPSIGVLEFFLFKTPLDASEDLSENIKTFDLKNQTPLCTLGFDGVSNREAMNFSPADGRFLVIRWNGSLPGEPLQLHQIDGFGFYKFEDYTVTPKLSPITRDTKFLSTKDSKQVAASGKSYKALLDPIAEGPMDPAPAKEETVPPLLPSPRRVPPIVITSRSTK